MAIFTTKTNHNGGTYGQKTISLSQQFSPINMQKNNADFEMALDVMEVVLTQNICTVIVVSSDVDFCPLANRVRQHGVRYWGFGHKWTPKKYQDACTHFFVSE